MSVSIMYTTHSVIFKTAGSLILKTTVMWDITYKKLLVHFFLDCTNSHLTQDILLNKHLIIYASLESLNPKNQNPYNYHNNKLFLNQIQLRLRFINASFSKLVTDIKLTL
jgi:hypothetical protein